jgi:hypothetical protein
MIVDMPPRERGARPASLRSRRITPMPTRQFQIAPLHATLVRLDPFQQEGT